MRTTRASPTASTRPSRAPWPCSNQSAACRTTSTAESAAMRYLLNRRMFAIGVPRELSVRLKPDTTYETRWVRLQPDTTYETPWVQLQPDKTVTNRTYVV